MMKSISQSEKADILLALAMLFEKNFAAAEERETAKSALELAEKSFSALNREDFENLKSRAALIDALTEENRENWRQGRLEKIRRRGLSKRLDENINPSQIVEVLSREPKAIQILILRNLPPDLSRRVSLYLDLNFVPEDKTNGKLISEEIVAPVRNKFLAHFIALEDVYEPDELDRFAFDELENFTRHLGLREVAIACRGISSKETLAAFLNSFEEEDAREIAGYITELERIRPFWVAQADELVRQSWSADLPPAKVIRKIGLKILAAAFVLRDETKCDYAAQKLPVLDVKNWKRLINIGKKKYFSADEEDKLRLDKRRQIVERLAVKFSQTGKL